MTEIDHRHRCEVRHLINCVTKKGRSWVKDYLEHRNVAGRAEALRADLNQQRRLGNTGRPNEWLTAIDKEKSK